MGDVRLHAASPDAQIVDAVMAGAPTPALLSHLDRLLHWLASPDSTEAHAIDALLHSRKIEPQPARRLALMLLEEALFSEPRRGPHHVLGLRRGATQAEARKRYHLLMRVYHPDRCARVSGWSSERAGLINEAYARIEHREELVPDPPKRGVTCSRDRRLRVRADRRRGEIIQLLRRKLGGPRALRRRVLAGVLIACAALVVHTCVAQRSWRDWRAATRVAPRSHAVPGAVVSWELAR